MTALQPSTNTTRTNELIKRLPDGLAALVVSWYGARLIVAWLGPLPTDPGTWLGMVAGTVCCFGPIVAIGLLAHHDVIRG